MFPAVAILKVKFTQIMVYQSPSYNGRFPSKYNFIYCTKFYHSITRQNKSAAVSDCYILSSHFTKNTPVTICWPLHCPVPVDTNKCSVRSTTVFHLTVAAVHLFMFWQHSNCYIPVPTAVIAQVSIMRNPSLFITVSVVPTCSATQSAKQELINTSRDVLQLSACSGRGDKRHTVAGRS